MLRHKCHLLGIFLPIMLVGLNFYASPSFAQKVKKQIVAFTPPVLSVAAEPAVVTACAGGDNTASLVHLNARASSSGSNPIRYHWSASFGRVEGDGAAVTWNLSGLEPGYYRAFVDIDTGSGDELCRVFSSTTVLVNRCPPPAPVCPNIVISCPERAILGEPLDFSATVTGGTSGITLSYNWTVSAGRIISGQGTPTIKVDTAGLSGQPVTATLSMGGYPMDCSKTCVVQLPVSVECRRFDEFPDIARNDEKARLDNYAIELQNDPSSTAYVVVYPGQRAKPGDVQKHTTRVVDYLVNSRGVDGHRIVTLVSPARPDLLVNLWVCPQGAKPPVPAP